MLGVSAASAGTPSGTIATMDVSALAPHVDGTVVLAGVVGSRAYGLARDGSDEDMLGVYAAPLGSILGLSGREVSSTTYVRTNPDVALHELAKFCHLCLSANPTVTELLWLDDYTHCSDEGQMLIDVRDAMLSTTTVKNSYAGYARSQAVRLMRRGKNSSARAEKHGRHCLRLLIQAEQLLSTATLTVNVAPYRDEIFAAGKEAVDDPETYCDRIERRIAALTNVTSVLPDTPDRDVVNDTVVTVRLQLAKKQLVQGT